MAAGFNPNAAKTFLYQLARLYESVAKERVASNSVSVDVATKIVAIGSIMHEAMKADVGKYADRIGDLGHPSQCGWLITPAGSDLV